MNFTKESLALLECSSDWIFQTDAGFIYRYSNSRVTDILGYSAEEIVGRPYSQFLSKESINSKSISAKTVIKSELVHKNGTLVQVETNIEPIFEDKGSIVGYRGSHKPLTHESCLIHTLSSVIDNIDNLVFYKDTSYRYMGCNSAFEEFYGHSRKEIIGHDDFEFLPHNEATHFRELDRPVIERGETVKNPQWVTYPDGREVFLLTTATPFFDKFGNLMGLVGNSVDITKEKLQSDILEKQANFDDLTKLPNRNLLMDRLEQTINMSKRHKSKFALFFMDLDKFKFVNDNFGHDSGDEVLREVSRRFLSCIRSSDTVARLGGDEFAAIITDIKGIEDATNLANKLISTIDKQIFYNGKSLHVTLSVGISRYPADAQNRDELLKIADDAMYKAKEQGKNRYALAADL